MAELTRTDDIADNDLIVVFKEIDQKYRGLQAVDLVGYLDEEVRGDPGPTGPGVPVGGTAGQVLSKVDGTDLNTEWVDPPNDSWGGITGTLSDQTDLQDALDAKEPTITKSSGILSWTGSAWAWLTSIAASLITQDSTHRMHTDAQAASWNGKQDALGFTAVPNTRTVAGKALSADVTLVKADVGLGNVDNTSDANKPVSTAQSTAIGLKENALGNPSTNGYVLSSTTGGTRSWVAQSGGTAGTTTVYFSGESNIAITTGEKQPLIVCPVAGTIVGWRMTSYPATTAAVSIWKTNNARPTVANVITASAPPTLTASAISSGTTLTGWTTSVAAGDAFVMNVDSNSAATTIYVALEIQ